MVTGAAFPDLEKNPGEKKRLMGSVAFCPSSGGLLFGCTAAARGFGKGILEFTATAAFGFDVRSPRFVAVTA